MRESTGLLKAGWARRGSGDRQAVRWPITQMVYNPASSLNSIG